MPTGMPSEYPQGIDMWGRPERFGGTERTSAWYVSKADIPEISSNLGDMNGMVGVSTASNLSNILLYSEMIAFLTPRALA